MMTNETNESERIQAAVEREKAVTRQEEIQVITDLSGCLNKAQRQLLIELLGKLTNCDTQVQTIHHVAQRLVIASKLLAELSVMVEAMSISAAATIADQQ